MIWRLAKELGVSDSVKLDLPQPADRLQPDTMIAYIPLQSSSERATPSLDFLIRGEYSLEDVIKNRPAVFPDGKAMTFDDVIKHCSQQIGTAHESDNIDPNLYNVRTYIIGNLRLHADILCRVARLALVVGDRVIEQAAKDRGYKVKARARASGKGDQP